jgi:hypothetical protein
MRATTSRATHLEAVHAEPQSTKSIIKKDIKQGKRLRKATAQQSHLHI